MFCTETITIKRSIEGKKVTVRCTRKAGHKNKHVSSLLRDKRNHFITVDVHKKDITTTWALPWTFPSSVIGSTSDSESFSLGSNPDSGT